MQNSIAEIIKSIVFLVYVLILHPNALKVALCRRLKASKRTSNYSWCIHLDFYFNLKHTKITAEKTVSSSLWSGSSSLICYHKNCVFFFLQKWHTCQVLWIHWLARGFLNYCHLWKLKSKGPWSQYNLRQRNRQSNKNFIYRPPIS